jgi:hypothetical protein
VIDETPPLWIHQCDVLNWQDGPPGGKAAHRFDPCVAACHVIGRLLDLSHISWRTYVADLLADHRIQA